MNGNSSQLFAYFLGIPRLESSPQLVLHGFFDRDVKRLKFVSTVSWNRNLDDVVLLQYLSELRSCLPTKIIENSKSRVRFVKV